MRHSSEANGKYRSPNSVVPTPRQDTPRRNLVISVARDQHSEKKPKTTQSLGISQRHVEAALGTIAPKAVLTLPPVPTSQGRQVAVELTSRERPTRVDIHQPKFAGTSSDVPSLVSLQEVVTVGLPGLPGVEDDLTIRRRRPAVIQQLIQDQILRKPGLNINEVDSEAKFSVLQHYGCREETLDDLLLVTFHLIVKIPVQAAADIIVDMPDWMRKSFLRRFKLPPLLNEVLASRIDGYEQPEDDIVAVMAEVVWSNALAAGSIAESAVTFFPPRFGRDSSLNCLKIDRNSMRLRSPKEMLTIDLEEIHLPVLIEPEEQEKGADTLICGSDNLLLHTNSSLKDVSNTPAEDDFLNLAQTVWGDPADELIDRISSEISNCKTDIEVDASGWSHEPMVSTKKDLNTNRFDECSSKGDVSASLTLPPMPGHSASGSQIMAGSKSSQNMPEDNSSTSNQVSLVRLDDGNLVLL